MKPIILLITSVALATFAAAAETLTIGPAHGLSDYTKLTAATGTSDRIFMMGFAVGDFNKDGRSDIVVQTGTSSANFLPFGAQMFLGETNGTFTKGDEQILPNTGLTWDFVTRDFNEDGNLDILMEDSDNDMVMMLGNGDGAFQPAQFLGLSAAGFFAVANLDGDSHLDLVAGKLDGAVGVFTGGGDGTFTLKTTLNTRIQASYPRFGEIQIGDLNGDAKLDVAVASVLDDSRQPGNLDVFLANGDGTFQEVRRTARVAVRGSGLGDFNGDGVLDYAGTGGSGTPVRLEIWIGIGNGHFMKGQVYSLSGVYSFAAGVEVGDINIDGIQDVVVGGDANGLPAAPLSIYLGNGNGTFRPRIPFMQANGNLPIDVGPQLTDFNGDGFLDMLTLSRPGTDPGPDLEAMSIALSGGVKRDSQLGALINVARSVGSMPAPVILEASSNLVTWTALATNLSASGNWLFTDTTANLSQRFYKTRRSED